jgi:hypothetical protein
VTGTGDASGLESVQRRRGMSVRAWIVRLLMRRRYEGCDDEDVRIVY